MKILITGIDGQLGNQLKKSSLRGLKVIGLKRKQFNLLDNDHCKKTILELKPDWIINTAAFTAVDSAEKEIKKAFDINAKAVETIAKTISSYGGRLLQISTDFVFDGSKKTPYLPTDKCNPINVYGASKLEGENLSLKYPGTLILRTSWLYGPSGNNFCLKILDLHNKAAKQSKNIRVVNDQIGSPTDTIQLSKICWGLIKKQSKNEINERIFHWSNRGIISWYDFAISIGKYAEEYGLIEKAASVKSVSSLDYKTIAKRPAFSALNCTNTEKLLNIKQLDWVEALKSNLRIYSERKGGK